MLVDKQKHVNFSVLMSVYSKENSDYLRHALESVINQSLVPSEIVLVKDGPLNEALDIVIESFKKKYKELNVVELKQNVGLGKALNEGLKHCRNNYVARMDADDFSNKYRFEKQISFLENNPDIDVIGSNVCEYDEKMQNKLKKKVVPETDSEIKKYLTSRNPFNHMTVAYKKDKVLEAGGYLDCPFFEDYYLWCRMMKNNCTFYNIQDCLVDVRAGDSMINRRGGLSYNKCILNFQKKAKKLGVISWSEYYKNIIIRVIVSSCPSALRSNFYRKVLRG